MNGHSQHHQADNANAGDFDRSVLLQAVRALRDEVRSMESDMRQALGSMEGHIHDVVQENERLHDQIGSSGRPRQEDRSLDDAQRVQNEVEQLMQMFEATKTARPQPCWFRVWPNA